MTATRAYCTFRLAGQLYGLEVSGVQEVLRAAPVTRLPLAPECVRGLVNLRGQLVTVVDLRRCLGLGDTPREERAAHVVVGAGAPHEGWSGAVSLLVDEIGDVLDVADDARERVPVVLDGIRSELLQASAPMERGLLLLLDLEKTLHAAFTQGESS